MPFSKIELQKFISTEKFNTEKIAVRNLIDIYNDKWRPIIRQELLSQFTVKSYKKLKPMITQEMNLIKRVTDETSLVYKNPAERVAILDDTETDDNGKQIIQIDENYEEITKESNLNVILKSVNKFTTLTNQALLRIVWRDNKLDYDIITFDNAELFTDPEDWKKIIAIKYYINLELPNFDFVDDETGKVKNVQEGLESIREGKEREQFLFSYLYTIEDDGDVGRIFKFKLEGDEEVLMDGFPQENPYRDEQGKVIFPFVLFTSEFPTMQLLNHSKGNDLFDANMNVAINMIHLNELIKFQSYKQLWMNVKDKSKIPNTMDFDAETMIVTESEDGEASVNVLDMQANIDTVWNIIQNRILTILSGYGISPQNFTLSGIPASGISIKLDNRQLLEMREDDIELYRMFEKELFKKTRIINNFHNTKQIDVKAKFKIDFGEIDFPTNPDEENRDHIVKIKNNIETSVDWIKQENPDLTDEEALLIFEKNKALNDKGSRGVVIKETQQPGDNLQENKNAAQK